MSVLSDIDIEAELKQENIVISPYNEKHVNTSSYDVTLGPYFYRESDILSKDIYNPYDKDDVKIWKNFDYDSYEYDKNNDCLLAPRKKDIIENFKFLPRELENISDDDQVILIFPGENLLCHTNEFIGGRNNITTMMKARSSIGRSLLSVCQCAGWGDVGYVNRWTMEVTNKSKHYIIPLVVGRRIAQIVFFKTGDTNDSYENTGKYQSKCNLKDSKIDIEKLALKWKPSDMLPKLYMDKY